MDSNDETVIELSKKQLALLILGVRDPEKYIARGRR